MDNNGQTAFLAASEVTRQMEAGPALYTALLALADAAARVNHFGMSRAEIRRTLGPALSSADDALATVGIDRWR